MVSASVTRFVEELQRTAGGIRIANEERDVAIAAALDAGVPVQRIADAVGLSRQRVWQIGRAPTTERKSSNGSNRAQM